MRNLLFGVFLGSNQNTMNRILLLATFLVGTTLFAQQTNETIDVNGDSRTYVRYLPTGFDPNTESLPVVLIFHGLGDVATNMANIGANQMADTARFIPIYPQGKANAWGNNAWNNGTLLGSTADDVSFAGAIINDLILNHNADPTRIYSTGFSMGGIMSYRLACELNDRIASIASMSGTMSTNDLSNCNPTYLTPVLHIHGTADATVPYDSGALPSLSLVPQTMDFWRNAHGCATTSDSTQFPDIASEGITFDRFVYHTCNPDGSVELIRMNGADHIYPYQPQYDITGMFEAWRFFRQWSHSNPTPAGLDDLNLGTTFSVHPNPSDGNITLESSGEETLKLIDVSGSVIRNIAIVPGENTLNLSDLKAGVYVLMGPNGFSQRVVLK